MQQMANAPHDAILAQRVMFGTPEAVIDRCYQYQEELGITAVVMEMHYGCRIPYDRVLNSIRLMTEKVILKVALFVIAYSLDCYLNL